MWLTIAAHAPADRACDCLGFSPAILWCQQSSGIEGSPGTGKWSSVQYALGGLGRQETKGEGSYLVVPGMQAELPLYPFVKLVFISLKCNYLNFLVSLSLLFLFLCPYHTAPITNPWLFFV